MSDMASVYERHRITLDEYHRMAEAGVFDPESRIELVDGELIEMPPIYPPHASSVDAIVRLFTTRLAERAWVRCQHPVTLRPSSEPQPDVVLARPDARRYYDRHPEAPETFLAVEVADISLAYDRSKKAALYARSGIAEFWIVDLVHEELIVHREPAGAWYGSIETYRRGDVIAPIAFPGDAFAVEELLPAV